MPKNMDGTMESFLNKKIIRIMIGLFVGIPFTAISIPLGLYGLLFGISGLFFNGSIIFALIGFTAITGLIGISGAWRRLLKSSDIICQKERLLIRKMLFSGLTSTLILFTLVLYFNYLEAIFPFTLLLLINLFFIYATPKNTNTKIKLTSYYMDK